VRSSNDVGSRAVAGGAKPGQSGFGRESSAAARAFASSARKSPGSSEFALATPIAFFTTTRACTNVSSASAFWWLSFFA